MAELTRKHKLALARYRKIISAVGLDERELLDRAAEDDPEAIVPVLDLMIDQVVRSAVIMTYTWIDSILDDVLTDRIAGTRKGGIGPKRRKTLELVLNRLYPLQKLAIIRTFKKVPKKITSSIGAIDELRNGLSHSFFVDSLPKHRRTYKGRSIFTAAGLELLRSEAREVVAFFDPLLWEHL
jgi:hypothetical protein